MQDDPVRKLKVGGGEWDDSLRKIGHLRSKCYGRITRLIPFFRCAERYFQAFNCNSPGVSGGVSSPIKQPFQAELAYAWFVASGTVKAEGMKVQAQAEGNLVIRHTTKNWGTVATADPYKTNGSVVAGSLAPASTANLTKWVHASADGPATYVSTSDYDVITSNVNPGTDDAGTCNGYVLVKQFFIRSATAQNAPKGLYIDKINVTVGETAAATAQNLSSSLRVGIQCTYGNNKQTLIYAPVGTGENAPAYGSIELSDETTINGVYVPADSATGKVAQSAMTPTAVTLAQAGWNADASAPYNELLSSTVTLPGAKTGDNASTSTSSDAVEVFVYVWFEGEDTHLYSDNFAAEAMDISIEFQSISTKSASASN